MRASTSPALQAEIDALFRARVENNHAPAACYAVFDRTGITFGRGFGALNDAGTVPDFNSAFRIASCSKSFTAAMILVLRDAGEIDLDWPITRFVPELRPTLPAASPVAPTLRMLLSMSGGLPTDDPWADRLEAISGDELRDLLRAGIRFRSTPGNEYQYSNLGYALLGEVVAQVTRQPFHLAVAESLLRPLGLTSTSFDYSDIPPERLVAGYRRSLDRWVSLPMTGPGAFSSIGGAITTATDLVTWANWLGAAFEDQDHDTVLCAASRREMQQIVRPIMPTADTAPGTVVGYGLGLRVEHIPDFGRTIAHGGGYPGFSSYMRWNAETGIGIVAFENATYSSVWVPATPALALVLKSVTPPSDDPEVPADVDDLGRRLATYLGDWNRDTADELFLPNVALDQPYEERKVEFDRLCGLLGTPDFSSLRLTCGREQVVSQFGLALACARGTLRCAVQLGPTTPPRIQKFDLTAEPAN